MLFRDRVDAGDRLAGALAGKHLPDAVVLSIPRGGVVVGAQIAGELGIPLDLIIPRKIGSPANPEVAIGAVAQDGTTYLNKNLINMLGVDKKQIDALVERETREIERRMKRYRGSSVYPDFQESTIILVDDGVATGYTILAAAGFVKNSLKPEKLVVAVPVAPPESLELLEKISDEVVCLHSPPDFYAVGQFYADFDQTGDQEVLDLLRLHQGRESFDPGS